MKLSPDQFEVHGKLIENAILAPYTWFRVGGPADLLFIPQDGPDLCNFLRQLPDDVPVTTLGVGSNVIIRDGGIDGVVIRLAGRYWGEVQKVSDTDLYARAGSLDLAVARTAAKLGMDGFSFLSGIPGSLGGAMRTNAGCYGRELKDILVRVEAVNRRGQLVSFDGPLSPEQENPVHLTYRHSDLPDTVIVTALELKGTGVGNPSVLKDEIAAHQARRSETQPIKDKTSGSTFANPDPPGTPNQRSAWKLIDEAGCRGLRVGGAQVSEKHCNFLINTGDARASDLEALGELVRARVLETSGVDLRWEVRRIGRY